MFGVGWVIQFLRFFLRPVQQQPPLVPDEPAPEQLRQEQPPQLPAAGVRHPHPNANDALEPRREVLRHLDFDAEQHNSSGRISPTSVSQLSLDENAHVIVQTIERTTTTVRKVSRPASVSSSTNSSISSSAAVSRRPSQSYLTSESVNSVSSASPSNLLLVRASSMSMPSSKPRIHRDHSEPVSLAPDVSSLRSSALSLHQESQPPQLQQHSSGYLQQCDEEREADQDPAFFSHDEKNEESLAVEPLEVEPPELARHEEEKQEQEEEEEKPRKAKTASTGRSGENSAELQ